MLKGTAVVSKFSVSHCMWADEYCDFFCFVDGKEGTTMCILILGEGAHQNLRLSPILHPIYSPFLPSLSVGQRYFEPSEKSRNSRNI